MVSIATTKERRGAPPFLSNKILLFLWPHTGSPWIPTQAKQPFPVRQRVKTTKNLAARARVQASVRRSFIRPDYEDEQSKLYGTVGVTVSEKF